MKPPHAEWRAWLYAVAWLAGGVAFFAASIWLVTLIRWGWSSDRAEQQLDILGNALLATLICAGLVSFGLMMRNAIRNFKGTAGAISLEASNDHHD